MEDKNNETDGDILIAWALLKAGKNGGTYTEESEQIFQAVMNHTVIDFAGKKCCCQEPMVFDLMTMFI